MELYQVVIVGLVGLLLTLMLLENERVNKIVWDDLIETGYHIESVLHPSRWKFLPADQVTMLELPAGDGFPACRWGVSKPDPNARWAISSEPYDIDSPYYGHRN